MLKSPTMHATPEVQLLLLLQAAPEYWRNLDPSWKHTGPPMRRYFHPDGYHSADPQDAVWGGHECTYTIITSFVGDGKIREHYVRINRWPPLKVSRKDDWSWELSNHLYRYNSIPDADKKGCTGPLFPVWWIHFSATSHPSQVMFHDLVPVETWCVQQEVMFGLKAS